MMTRVYNWWNNLDGTARAFFTFAIWIATTGGLLLAVLWAVK